MPTIGNEPSTENSRPTRIIVVDDHPLYRDALKQLLNGHPDLLLVAEAADGREAIELCRRLRPDLVLMDVRLPGVDGISATRAIKQETPRTVVLMLTASEDEKLLLEALEAGAAGFVLKLAADHEHLIDAIRGVLSGDSFPLDQSLATRLLLRLIDERHKKGEKPSDLGASGYPAGRLGQPPFLEQFTPREVDVFRLVAQGKTNEQIARSLFVSTSTVKKHVRQIIAKLGVSDRTQAAIRAAQLGMFSRESDRE